MQLSSAIMAAVTIHSDLEPKKRKSVAASTFSPSIHLEVMGLDAIDLGFCFVFNISVQFIPSVVSDSLWLHEPQHARPPCPSQTPGVHPNPCPSSRWCHPTISSSVIPFSSRLQCFPESGSFQMSQLFTSGGQSIGISASASVLPMNTQD